MPDKPNGEQLKPCPFCGCKTTSMKRVGFKKMLYARRCMCCYMFGPSAETEEMANIKWNTRQLDVEGVMRQVEKASAMIKGKMGLIPTAYVRKILEGKGE